MSKKSVNDYERYYMARIEAAGKSIKLRYKILWIAIFVVVVLIVGLVVKRQSEIDKRFEQIRADGYPVTLGELNAWYPVPYENAADEYMAAIGCFVNPS